MLRFRFIRMMTDRPSQEQPQLLISKPVRVAGTTVVASFLVIVGFLRR